MGLPVLATCQQVALRAGPNGISHLVILTSELSCCRQTEVEKLATRFMGNWADSAADDRAQRSGSMVAAFNGC